MYKPREIVLATALAFVIGALSGALWCNYQLQKQLARFDQVWTNTTIYIPPKHK